MTGMAGILNAQISVDLALQTNRIANEQVGAGRIRERQGLTDGNIKAIEEGQELQARGEETRLGVFEHLGNAIENIHAAAENREEREETQVPGENSQESLYTGHEHTPETGNELDITVGEAAAGGGAASLPPESNGSGLDITV